MLNASLFVLFSTFEFLSILLFMFVLFRLKIAHNKFHILFIAVLLSYISYNLHVAQLSGISPLLQMLVYFLLIWLMFRIQIFYALVISAISYISFGMVQSIFLVSLHLLNIITFDQIVPGTMLGYFLQICTATIMLTITLILKKLNWGYDYVPHNEFAPIKLKNENLHFLIIIVISVLFIGIVYYITLNEQYAMGFNHLITLLILTVILLIIISNKKNRSDDD